MTMNLFSILKSKRPVNVKSSKRSLRDASYLGERSSYMKALYVRIESYMRSQKPYLRGDFSLDVISRRLNTTRNNVSVAINNCSGLNFRNYINTYRVEYAMELMRRNPNMKKEEVAKLSGFNTLPTFNSSFRKHVNMTPGKYLYTHLMAEVIPRPTRHLSTLLAQKRQD